MAFRLRCFSLFIQLSWIAVCQLVDAAVPTNDACENAIALKAAEGQVMLGSTGNATPDGLNLCGENLVNSAGVWYLYQASTEHIVQVSTCTAETDFDTAVTVFAGFCPSLQCVSGRDDDLECDVGTEEHSTVSWNAIAGERYYVLVHGSQQEHAGNFGLITTATEPLDDLDSSSAGLYSHYWPLSVLSLRILVHIGAWDLLCNCI